MQLHIFSESITEIRFSKVVNKSIMIIFQLYTNLENPTYKDKYFIHITYIL